MTPEQLEAIRARSKTQVRPEILEDDIAALLDEIDSLTMHIADVENREIALQEALEGHRLMLEIQDRRIAHLVDTWNRLRDYWGNAPMGESQTLPWQVFDKCARELHALLDGRKPE